MAGTAGEVKTNMLQTFSYIYIYIYIYVRERERERERESWKDRFVVNLTVW